MFGVITTATLLQVLIALAIIGLVFIIAIVYKKYAKDDKALNLTKFISGLLGKYIGNEDINNVSTLVADIIKNVNATMAGKDLEERVTMACQLIDEALTLSKIDRTITDDELKGMVRLAFLFLDPILNS